MSGPRMNAMPNTRPKKPWYLPRSAGVKRSPMTASAIGKRAPAPRPWIPRNSTSCHISWLSPDSADDRLVQRGEEHAEQDGAEDLELGALRQTERWILSEGRRLGLVGGWG